MQWKPNERYANGWFVGGQLKCGSHTREVASEHGGHNWPFSIYRKAIQPGVTDCCLCEGIQSLADANALCTLLNQQVPNAE